MMQHSMNAVVPVSIYISWSGAALARAVHSQ
jgi:hypothetical protein